jgi:hypothetical protein
VERALLRSIGRGSADFPCYSRRVETTDEHR